MGKHIKTIHFLPRFIISFSSLLASITVGYAIFCLMLGGIHNILLSQSVVYTGVMVFAIGMIFGLLGDVLIKKTSG